MIKGLAPSPGARGSNHYPLRTQGAMAVARSGARRSAGVWRVFSRTGLLFRAANDTATPTTQSEGFVNIPRRLWTVYAKRRG